MTTWEDRIKELETREGRYYFCMFTGAVFEEEALPYLQTLDRPDVHKWYNEQYGYDFDIKNTLIPVSKDCLEWDAVNFEWHVKDKKLFPAPIQGYTS